MTNEEAKTFLDNLKVCIEEHPIVADWLVEIADRKSEPQTDTDFTLTYACSFSDCENFKHFGFGEKCIECKRKQSKAMRKTEPQTEMEKSGSRAVQTARCLNCHNAKACKENHWEVCKYEPWKLTAVDDEPQIDCRRCKHYATDKCKECFGHELFTDSGYATDCSWQKGE